ncbi:MAG: hypothetical protein RL172_674 [Bacteroidota bacterium]|jgi:hypothetical protein
MWKKIVNTALLCGSLDITAACMHAYLARGIKPGFILQYIASGVFGEAAYTGHTSMMLWGLFFHFIIAFACTAIFFIAYPRWGWLHHTGSWLNALMIALVAWIVTTRLIIPLSNIASAPFNLLNALLAIGILWVCIGLPIAVSARHYFKNCN